MYRIWRSAISHWKIEFRHKTTHLCKKRSRQDKTEISLWIYCTFPFDWWRCRLTRNVSFRGKKYLVPARILCACLYFFCQKCFLVYSFRMIFLGEFLIAELVPAGPVCNCLPRISTFFSNGKLKFTPNRVK